MPTAPCIEVPSPAEIKAALFPNGAVQPPLFDPTWSAIVLLTPPGGGTRLGRPPDELMGAQVSYDGRDPNSLLMRVRLLGIESLCYADILFATVAGSTSWWYLESAPGDAGVPAVAGGPFATSVKVPPSGFLTANHFIHAGTWDVNSRASDAFSAANTHPTQPGAPPAGTWIWTLSGTSALARIMTTIQLNDFNLPIFGAFYLSEFANYQPNTVSVDLRQIFDSAPKTAAPPARAIAVLAEVQKAIDSSPARSATCTWADIEVLFPGIRSDASAVVAPAWTERVTSQCYMIGQDLYPYHCQLYYDVKVGRQVTVFVFQDDNGSYNTRGDELLPKGAVGPQIVYDWSGNDWALQCSEAGGGAVPMPVPNFVAAGGGRCRAAFSANPYYGDASIWSVSLGDASGSSDFWYRFDGESRGVIFSLSPAHSLTIIDYQTFEQNGVIEPCVFDDPTPEIPACAAQQSAFMAIAKFTPVLGQDVVDRLKAQ